MARLASRPASTPFTSFPPPRGESGHLRHEWSECLRLTQRALELLEAGDTRGAQALLAHILALAPVGTPVLTESWHAHLAFESSSSPRTPERAESRLPAEPEAPGNGHGEEASCAKAAGYPIRILALGGFELAINGVRLASGVKPQRRPLDLLKVLVAANGSMASASDLADQLWPDSDGDTGRNSLQVAIHRLRRLLGSDAAVVVQNRKVYLDHSLCWVDLWAFADEAEWALRCDSSHPGFAQQATAALRLYRGHLFSQEPEQAWILAPRERARRLWTSLVRRLGEHYEACGDWPQAANLYQQALDVDVLAEEVYRRLMRCQLRVGERAEAMCTYRRCCEQLASTLGVAPSAETERVHQTLRLVA